MRQRGRPRPGRGEKTKYTSPAAFPASDVAWIMVNEVMPSLLRITIWACWLVAHHRACAVGPLVVRLGRAGRRHARSCGLVASASSGLPDPGV